MRISLKLAVAATVFALGLAGAGTQPALADDFVMSGTFDTTSFAGPLNGGSFSGTFSVTGFPFSSGQVVPIPTFDVFFFNSSNTLLEEITPSVLGASNVDTRFDATAGDILNFSFGFGTPSFVFLELQFPAGFSGTGSVIPFGSHLDGFGSFAGIGANSFSTDSGVASGQVSPVPEPSSLPLFGTGLVALTRSILRKLLG